MNIIMMINTTAVGNFKNYRQLQALMGFLLVHLTAAHHQFKTKKKNQPFNQFLTFVVNILKSETSLNHIGIIFHRLIYLIEKTNSICGDYSQIFL